MSDIISSAPQETIAYPNPRRTNYNPAHWYWIVDGDASRLWSSAAAAYVPADDAAYLAWLETGARATRIPSEADLQEVLAQQYPAGWPHLAVKAQLAALDALLPRALENFWEITNFDIKELRSNHQAILTEKIALRKQLV